MTHATANVHLLPMAAPTFEVVTLTPELAGEWLALNLRNRPKKPRKIEMYARDMTNGLWRFTGEAVKFDSEGRLIDGQNRCYAVIESGVSIQVLVVRGLDPNTQEVMDSNAVRSSRDALAMHGFDNPKDLAATVLVHDLYNRGVFEHCMSQTPGYERPSNAQVVIYAENHPELAGALRLVAPVKYRLPLSIGALATAHVTMSAIDADDTADFFERITELRTYGKGDPVATLLKRVHDMHQDRARRYPSTALYLLFRAWNAYRSGEMLTKFQFGSEGRWTPIPEPK